MKNTTTFNTARDLNKSIKSTFPNKSVNSINGVDKSSVYLGSFKVSNKHVVLTSYTPAKGDADMFFMPPFVVEFN